MTNSNSKEKEEKKENYYKIECPICHEEVITTDNVLKGFTKHCVYQHRMVDVISTLFREADLYDEREKCDDFP